MEGEHTIIHHTPTLQAYVYTCKPDDFDILVKLAVLFSRERGFSLLEM